MLATALTGVASALAERLSARPVHEFTLDNGMQVVVIPDTRAPVVTHMVWYKVGAADEPRGKSGIAHFLEHLMFKATEKLPSGEFSKTVSRLGGQDNAFTSQDATAYFQRISREHLPTVMAMEADRMVNLRLDEAEVLTERDVVKEERRSRVENQPSSLLSEQMEAALYMSHPYGIPVIGWMHEIAELSREDALAFYKQHYAPNNAILIVAGDVEPQQVLELAGQTYGLIPSNPSIAPRRRVSEPPHLAARRVMLVDERAAQPILRRTYLAPSYQTAEGLDAEALDLMMKMLASGSTSRLYRELVVNQKIAASASGSYSGFGMDSGRISFGLVPAPGVTLEQLEAGLDAVIEDFIANGGTELELERARKVYSAEYIFEMDSQSSLARRYGWGLVVGSTIAQIDGWPNRLKEVTLADIKRVAEAHLKIEASVTGLLTPKAERQAGDAKATADRS